MALQGYARFGKLSQVLSFNFTFSLGVAPSVATLVVPPVTNTSQLLSDVLQIEYGNLSIIWPDCRVDRIDIGEDAAGQTVWRLTILDRRWRWSDRGAVSGYYNVRRDGLAANIITETLKSPRELARLCLDEMGETQYDLSQMPNVARPEIEWDFTLPAEALARLCDSLGCRVALGIDNRVRIVRLGVGGSLPEYPILDGDLGLDPPDPPERLAIVGDRIRWQGDFELEAVGLEVDGEVKPIDSLSYSPKIAEGVRWYDPDHFQDVTDLKARRVARESVFRWYRIKTPFRLPNWKEKITSLDRILPLDSKQIETRSIDGRMEPLPPWVYGVFWDGDESGASGTEEVEDDVVKRPKGYYYRSFAVDQETSIVKFSEPVYQLVFDDKAIYGYLAKPAELKLRIACNLRHKETRGWYRSVTERKAPGKPKKKGHKRYILRDDVKREIYQTYGAGGKVEDNEKEALQIAEHYLALAEAEYQTKQAGSFTYAGFLPLSPDGAIQQVTWSIDGRGFATTRASYNKEELLFAPSYEERRLLERTAAALYYSEKTSRERAETARKGRA